MGLSCLFRSFHRFQCKNEIDNKLREDQKKRRNYFKISPKLWRRLPMKSTAQKKKAHENSCLFLADFYA